MLVNNTTAAEAVSAPRWHHQWMPNAVLSEADFPGNDSLQAAGHDVRIVERPFSAVQAVRRTEAGFDAGSDPRKGGAPAYSKGP
mgnify:FL=1